MHHQTITNASIDSITRGCNISSRSLSTGFIIHITFLNHDQTSQHRENNCATPRTVTGPGFLRYVTGTNRWDLFRSVPRYNRLLPKKHRRAHSPISECEVEYLTYTRAYRITIFAVNFQQIQFTSFPMPPRLRSRLADEK